jgi:Xaa-Pro aminopeptidase
MFAPETYIRRRRRLQELVSSGLLLFLGNDESPMNCADNAYPFRQDSTFLYYWGLDFPGLAAVVDLDRNREIVFGSELTLDDIMWGGPAEALSERCRRGGADDVRAPQELQTIVSEALRQKRAVHFLPPYRAANAVKLHTLTGTPPGKAQALASAEFIRAVVSQRSIKTEDEIRQIEAALETTRGMHLLAMQQSAPGHREREIVAAMAQLAWGRSGAQLAFPPIFSRDGHIFHNPHHGNTLQEGDLVVNDSGAEGPMHYASDVTRTFPASGKFTPRQKELYSLVLDVQQRAIDAVRPGIEYREVHHQACLKLTEGLKTIGLMKGDVPAAVAAGAHALFMPHGLGHMLGLDVHDMEDLGEEFVGYTDTIRRSPQFGTRQLRLARALEPGFVITVEPGVYFIPPLIDRWQAQNMHRDFIDYAAVGRFRDTCGIRIEDDVLVTATGGRVLGPPIPKTVAELETIAAERRQAR